MAESTPTSPANTQRLRTSCDLCQAAKVKCSRAKPSCWRCSQSGQQCVYSPLKRTGRPKISSTSDTSLQDDGEEGSRQQNKAQKRKNESGWHQRKQQQEQQQQQQYGDHSFLAGLAKVASPKEMDTALAQSEMWQSGSTVLQPDLHQLLDVAQMHPNDIMLDFQTSGFDIQDIVPDFEAFDPNLNIGGTTSPRNMSDNRFHSSTASSASWSSGLWNCPTANDASPDCPAPPTTSMPFSAERSVSRDDFRSRTNVATEDDAPLTTSSNQASEQAGLLSQVNNRPSTVASPVSHSVFAQPQPTSIGSTASSESATPGLVQTSSHPNPRHSSDCYSALSEIMALLSEDRPEGEGMSLDKLLGLDRELHGTIKRVLACRRCMEKSSNQTMIMLMFMALDTLLCLFEKQQNAAATQTAIPQLFSWRALATTTTTRSAAGEDSTRTVSQFPCMDKAILVGSFVVDGKVKTIFLRHLVLAFVENLGSLLSELERQADRVLKGVNRRMAKEIAVDICRRTLFFQGWLRLAS